METKEGMTPQDAQPAQVSPGPWRQDSWRGVALFAADDELAIVATHGGNRALCLAAVNACFQLNPQNPLAAAEGIAALVEAAKKLDGLPMNAFNREGWIAVYDLRAALAAIEAAK